MPSPPEGRREALLPPQELSRLSGASASASAKSENLRRGRILYGVEVIVCVVDVDGYAQIVARDQLLGDLARDFHDGFDLPFSVTLQDEPWGTRNQGARPDSRARQEPEDSVDLPHTVLVP